MSKIFNRSIKLAGDKKSSTLRVLAYDKDNKVLICTGTSVPTGAGFAKGCLFMKTDVVAGTKGLYENQGDTTTASFNVIGDIATAEIASGAVTLAKLDAGITPSHVTKYAGTVTWSGSGATYAPTVSGVVAGDLVVATIRVKPTQAAYLVRVVPSTNTLTFELSAANTSNDAQISYQVLRAAA